MRLLPLDKLKIDRSFISDIEHHRPSEDIVKTVLQLCSNLRIDCIVEGVETQEQLEKVASLGGVMLQGYHFARPMPASFVAEYLAEESSRVIAKRREAKLSAPSVPLGSGSTRMGLLFEAQEHVGLTKLSKP